MVNILRSAGHDVLVCSKPHERGFAILDAELSAYRPDLVVVAYTPLGYAPSTGGIAPAFYALGIRLRGDSGAEQSSWRTKSACHWPLVLKIANSN